MSVDLLTIFIKGASLSFSAAKFSGLIEDNLSTKLERLVKSEFNSAVCELLQAANSVKEQDSLLREARSRFNKAIQLESGPRLGLSYLGLAICHKYLGDLKNAHDAIELLSKVQAPKTPVLETVSNTGKIAQKAYYVGRLGGPFGLLASFAASLLGHGVEYASKIAIEPYKIEEKKTQNIKI